MALFDNYKEGDIYKNIPESIKTLGKEAWGLAETGTTIATAIPAQLGGIGYAMYDEATKQPDPVFIKMEKWLEKNKSKASHPKYQTVLKDFNFRKSNITQPEQVMEETASNLTYMPRGEEGQRNLSAIGDTLEALKIPAYVPGVGNVGRIGYKVRSL